MNKGDQLYSFSFRPQGEVKYSVPRLHVDFPIILYSDWADVGVLTDTTPVINGTLPKFSQFSPWLGDPTVEDVFVTSWSISPI